MKTRRIPHTEVLIEKLKKGPADQKELADTIGKTPHYAGATLRQLQKTGRVIKKSNGQLGRYASTWAVWELVE